MATHAISIKGLVKEFSGVRALDDITLSVKKGELFGLIGPNGSGKTTMIRCLTGQTLPDEGSLSVQGIDVLKKPVKVREVTGIIPEQENPPSFLTAEEYLVFVGRVRNLTRIHKKIDAWFRYLNCDDQRDVLCKDLSRGTRQKLMFAQAFLHEPDIAFIDEPLINLDPVTQKRVKDFLRQQVKEKKTIFFSTHVLEIAEEICTRIGIIDKGNLIHEGSVQALKRKKEKLEKFFITKVENA